MKWTASTKGLIISTAVTLIAFGIYFLFLAKKNDYVVDNPTSEVYYFKINKDAEKIIAAGQTVQVDLKKGINKISVYNKDKQIIVDSSFTVSKPRGLLNIAHQDYFVHKQYYGYNINKDSLLLQLEKTNIDGKMYLGAPQKINKLYTEDFYYNVNEDYDEVIKNIQKVEFRSKIFRKEDFLNYYDNYYPKIK